MIIAIYCTIIDFDLR